MADDDQSPERTRSQNVADWTDISQQEGKTPSHTERVVDAVNREGTSNAPANTPQEARSQQSANDMWEQDELEYAQQLDRQQYANDPTTPSDFEQPAQTPSDNAQDNPGAPAPDTPMSEEGGSWFEDDTDAYDPYADAMQAMNDGRDPIGAGIDAIGEATQNIYDGVSDAVQNAYDSFGDSGGESFSGDDGGGWE